MNILATLLALISLMNPVRKDYDGSSPQLEEWIVATWPVELVDEAINVAWCESRGKPTARNGQYRGILQMGRREWAKFGKGDPFDPYANSAAADSGSGSLAHTNAGFPGAADTCARLPDHAERAAADRGAGTRR